MMRKATFDLLDAEISKKYNEYIADYSEVRERFFTEKFWLDVPNWQKYFRDLSTFTFVWNEFKYTDINVSNQLDTVINSNDTGIYMFIIKPENQIYGLPKFVMYIGLSGENNSSRPLKDRLKDYYKFSQVKKRDAVLRLLEKYYKNIYVAYALLNLSMSQLKQIETALIGFFYPQCNKDDFPVELQPIKKSF